jgi:hypothetical protein
MDDQGAAPFCYLTTAGRVSGRPHSVEIWFALQDDFPLTTFRDNVTTFTGEAGDGLVRVRTNFRGR